jgi:phosphate transport system substrate-binding protein
MKKLLVVSIFASASAFAQSNTTTPVENSSRLSIQGSDTLAGFLSDVIVSSGLEDQVVYQGGGSGKGEAALAAGLQGIAPMSREMKPEILAAAEAAGITVIKHEIGLDGIGIFINSANPQQDITMDAVVKIFTCQYTNWKQLGALDAPIVVYRRDDFSGTTDTFKTLTGVKTFGDCVKVLKETSDIAVATSTEINAVAYSGLSAGRPGENRPIPLSLTADTKSYLPTPANIRTFNYPLSRKLYVYEAAGAYVQKASETQLLGNILDRSFADPILVDNEFFTID